MRHRDTEAQRRSTRSAREAGRIAGADIPRMNDARVWAALLIRRDVDAGGAAARRRVERSSHAVGMSRSSPCLCVSVVERPRSLREWVLTHYP